MLKVKRKNHLKKINFSEETELPSWIRKIIVGQAFGRQILGVGQQGKDSETAGIH